MTTKKTYKELETLNTRGTKRYQRRLIEEREAEDMIRNLDEDEDVEVIEDDRHRDYDGV